MTEEEKMLAGKLYDPSDPKLQERLHYAHRFSQEYNLTFDDETEKREEILTKLVSHHAAGTYLQGPIFFDYGSYTQLGKHFYANANFTVLDCGYVTIGSGCVIGAGSVVTRDIPANSLAVGNPCRVVREIIEADSIKYKSEIQ